MVNQKVLFSLCEPDHWVCTVEPEQVHLGRYCGGNDYNPGSSWCGLCDGAGSWDATLEAVDRDVAVSGLRTVCQAVSMTCVDGGVGVIRVSPWVPGESSFSRMVENMVIKPCKHRLNVCR